MNGTKFTELKRSKYLEALRGGARRGAAAVAAGTNRWTVNSWAKEHADFAAEVERAEMDANELVEDALLQAALKGNTTAMIFWLTNRCPDRWKDKRNAGVTINNLEGMSADQLKEMMRARGMHVD